MRVERKDAPLARDHRDLAPESQIVVFVRFPHFLLGIRVRIEPDEPEFETGVHITRDDRRVGAPRAKPANRNQRRRSRALAEDADLRLRRPSGGIADVLRRDMHLERLRVALDVEEQIRVGAQARDLDPRHDQIRPSVCGRRGRQRPQPDRDHPGKQASLNCSHDRGPFKVRHAERPACVSLGAGAPENGLYP